MEVAFNLSRQAKAERAAHARLTVPANSGNKRLGIAASSHRERGGWWNPRCRLRADVDANRRKRTLAAIHAAAHKLGPCR